VGASIHHHAPATVSIASPIIIAAQARPELPSFAAAPRRGTALVSRR
jgi:hypothetical protein